MGVGCSRCCCCFTTNIGTNGNGTNDKVVEDEVLSGMKDMPVSTNPITRFTGEGEEEEEEEDTTLDKIQESEFDPTPSTTTTSTTS